MFGLVSDFLCSFDTFHKFYYLFKLCGKSQNSFKIQLKILFFWKTQNSNELVRKMLTGTDGRTEVKKCDCQELQLNSH